jgi:hypothetical protein
MIRIDNSSLPPEVTPARPAGSSPTASGSGTGAQASDEVQLSHAGTALPEGRAERIAALKITYSSPDYLPPSLPISRKLISGALSRTD